MSASLEAQLDLAKRLVKRLPLCSDHRDKEQPETCVRCECERLQKVNAALLEALGDLYAPHFAAHPSGECKCPHFAKARAAIRAAKETA